MEINMKGSRKGRNGYDFELSSYFRTCTSDWFLNAKKLIDKSSKKRKFSYLLNEYIFDSKDTAPSF
jgi:hypothetical protein